MSRLPVAIGSCAALLVLASCAQIAALRPAEYGASPSPSTSASFAGGTAGAGDPGSPQSATPTPSPTSARPLPTAKANPEPKGPAQFVPRVETADRVVFLTLDDGAVADPALISYLKENRVPITTFLTTDYARGNWDYWSQISQLGSVQNHTVSHPTLTKLGESGAAEQICQANEEIASHLGKTPWMLRPPYGVYGQSTLAAAGDCGLDYVVHWSVSLPDEEIQYQVGPGFRPGDIILSHYRSDLIPHLGILLAEIKRQGFTVARLEDYLPPKA